MKVNFLEQLKTLIKSQPGGQPSRFKKFTEKLDTCSLRDRVMILIIVFVLIFAVWYFGLMYPLGKSKIKLRLQQAVKMQQIKDITQKYQIALASLQGKDTQGKQKELQEQLKKLDQNINQIVGDVIPIEKMADVLKEVLSREHHLNLISLKSLSAKELGTPADDKNSNYRLINQGVEMVFEGNYSNTFNYLRYLEQSKWRIFWDRLSYDVAQYPNAKVTIDLHTLIQYKKPAVSATESILPTKEESTQKGIIQYQSKPKEGKPTK